MMGGSKENRHTPGLEHWSLAVKNGKALEQEWRPEIPIPRGGPHRFVCCLICSSFLTEALCLFTKIVSRIALADEVLGL